MVKKDYGAKDLAVLEGLDAVRKRPGMYIGTTDSQGLMHCLWEIIDNSVDEALAGFCNRIIVTLHTDGSISVDDNGRGIPVDKEPKTKLSGVEVVLTKLHAGAKFGNSSYNAVGGLHGVGSSVVNALSSRLDVEVDRDGKTYHMAFHQGHPGIYTDADPEHPSPDSPFKRTRKNRPTELDIIGKVPAKRTGTRIRYWADPEIFNKTAEFSYEQLVDRVRQTSFLVPGLKITVIDENIPETRESGDTASESETNGANDTVAQPVASADEAAAAGTAAASDTADTISTTDTSVRRTPEKGLSDLLKELYAKPLAERHVEADGLVFDPAQITRRTVSGVAVPHGDHYHFIPYSQMSALEEQIARIIPIKSQKDPVLPHLPVPSPIEPTPAPSPVVKPSPAPVSPQPEANKHRMPAKKEGIAPRDQEFYDKAYGLLSQVHEK